ncbi:hypothetical protein DFR58_11037 [Anaerobacterium chartisolvens]|uniref:Uncharacterized protein n=2 Tax=Anaerobacterium chartisolvens TaxID=1297424 RepID=A0A369BA32_9FIRM|nr:hypothetical protein DFR58_11037 [Anaerobacterium chartisolvens]
MVHTGSVPLVRDGFHLILKKVVLLEGAAYKKGGIFFAGNANVITKFICSFGKYYKSQLLI